VQAVRNAADLAGMACPPKYRQMNSFYKYYSGEKAAPVLTIFIGGNHEASAHLCELPFGGWVAPNIFYLGWAGVVNVGGVRIGGLTGIYNGRHYHQGHYERPPFGEDDMRSVYHVRELEVLRLRQLRRPIDIFLSHDWPQHIARHGDTPRLLKRKSFLQAEVANGSLGSPPAMEVLQALRPRYWFSAHLHTKFAAVVNHADGSCTRFLSLDKCLPNRDFLQLFEIEGDGADGPPTLSYDAEWLAVLRATAHLSSSVRCRGGLPLSPSDVAAASGGKADFVATHEDEAQVRKCANRGDLCVPLNFEQTVRPYAAGETIHGTQVPPVDNPQTVAFVTTFDLPANWQTQRGATFVERQTQQGATPTATTTTAAGHVAPVAASLPEPVSDLPPPDPASYAAMGPPHGARAMGLLSSLPLDEEIDIDDD
jgi:lariat debranching enzyme